MNDLKPFEHGSEGTHSACPARLQKEGGKTQCCECVPHEDCESMKDNFNQKVEIVSVRCLECGKEKLVTANGVEMRNGCDYINNACSKCPIF